MLLAKFACRASVVLMMSLVWLPLSCRAQETTKNSGHSTGTVPEDSAQTASSTIKTKTRLINVDVVATDSHGNVVRGLTNNDFKVYDGDGVQQDIAQFKFVDPRMRQNGAPKPYVGPGVFSNLGAASERMSPTVILMDALNTETEHQMAIRRDMLLCLERLPNTQVAILLLVHKLQIVQDFTTDPATLRAALQRVVSPRTNEKDPQSNPDSLSNIATESGTNTDRGVNTAPGLEDSEKREYEASIRKRAEETADGMTVIADFLSGSPGRKNLIWFSEAFPIWIGPNSDFGTDPFSGTGSYQSEMQAAAASLMDSGVVVYPADARGLEGSQVYSAQQRPTQDELTGAGMARALKREDVLRQNSEATLQQMADDTGGRACENTNDLAGCAIRAVNEAYYEISYYPANVKWDDRFHKITIKISKRGIQLAYRRGYIATNR